MDLLGGASDLRAAAQECRVEAARLHRDTAALSWQGQAGDAFRAASHAHISALHLVAQELEVAAAAVTAHQVASHPVALADVAVGIGVSVVKAVW